MPPTSSSGLRLPRGWRTSPPIAKPPMAHQPFAGRCVAVSGASGSLGRALLTELHRQGARLIALSSGSTALELHDAAGQPIPLEQVPWRCGEEQALRPVLERRPVG